MKKAKDVKAVVVKKEKALARVEPLDTSPAMLLAMAVEQGADVDKMSKLMDMKIRWEQNEAKKAYVVAMTAFKANPPKIFKDKTVDVVLKTGGKMKYNHASLANVVEKISTALSAQGLSASWVTKQNGEVIVTCRITHVLGHSEETTLQGKPDNSGSKNDVQAVGSTVTYLQRYTILALTGLATEDMDNDGRGADKEVEYITDKQQSILCDIIDNMRNADVIRANTLKFVNAPSIDKILASDYNKVIAALNTTKKGQK